MAKQTANLFRQNNTKGHKKHPAKSRMSTSFVRRKKKSMDRGFLESNQES